MATMAPTDIIKNTLVTEGEAFEALGLAHRVHIPAHLAPGQRCPTLVMVHGFQGNEDLTWVFAKQASPDWLIVSPRAPLAVADLGYSWHEFRDGKTQPESLAEGLAALTRFVDRLPEVYPADRGRLVMLGFSQGAGMCYAFAAAQASTAQAAQAQTPPGEPPPPLLGVAALGGYIPGPVTLPPLDGLPVLILHGTRDEVIPITMARKNRDQLNERGAAVTYHEDEIGHKVSAEGMRHLRAWLAHRLQP
jgi:phospholipase/carboxylesterase